MNTNSNNMSSAMGGNFSFTAPFQVNWSASYVAFEVKPLTGGPGNVTIQALSNGATGAAGMYVLDSSTFATRQYISLDASGIINMQCSDGSASFVIGTDGVVTVTPTGSGKGINISGSTATLKINGTQVVGVRNTGWSAMTGGADTKGGLDTTTVTLPQLAQIVKALINAGISHGSIGA